MKINKQFLSLISGFAIVLFIYVFAFLIIPFEKNGVCWLSFAFTIIAALISFVIGGAMFSKDQPLKSKIYGLPILRVLGYYVAIQFGLGIVFCLFSSLLEDAMWFVLLVYIVIAAAAILGVLATDSAKDIIENMESKTEQQTKAVKLFSLNIGGLVDSCVDPEVKKMLQAAAEDIRYSDPVSSEYTADIEARIFTQFQVVRATIGTHNASAEIQNLRNMIAERNRVCKAFKR